MSANVHACVRRTPSKTSNPKTLNLSEPGQARDGEEHGGGAGEAAREAGVDRIDVCGTGQERVGFEPDNREGQDDDHKGRAHGAKDLLTEEPLAHYASKRQGF